MKCVFDSKRIEMGNRIRTLRKRRVGSQSEFAEKLDVSVISGNIFPYPENRRNCP